MDRDRALPLIVALLAIVALGAAAATLDSTVVPGGGSGFGGDDAGVGGDSGGNATGSPAPADRNATGLAEGSSVACLPVLAEPPALFAGLLLFVGLFAAVYRSTRSGVAAVAACGAVGLPVGLLWSALAVCGPAPAPPGSTATPNEAATNGTGGAEGGSGGLGGGAEALSSPTLLVALFVLIALLVVVVVLSLGSDRPGATEEPPEEEPSEEEPAEAVGRVAGSAADRIDAADVDAENEVYRAWTRMTAALDVDSPETTTPRGFQRAAVEAGMDRSDVAALTELFESVRYGGLDPTDEQERAAVETLRRIEAGYGGD